MTMINMISLSKNSIFVEIMVFQYFYLFRFLNFYGNKSQNSGFLTSKFWFLK